MEHLLTCETCGKRFDSVRLNARYCTHECRKKARNERDKHKGIDSICPVCGKAFKAKPFNVKSGGGKCCSHECGRIYRYGQPKEQKPETIKCFVCGSEFKPKNGRKYCGDACKKRAACTKQRNRAKEEHDKQKKTRQCKWCGRQFSPEYGTGKRSYCSEICTKKAQQNYKSVANRIRIHKTTYKINGAHINPINRKLICERDKWMCQICGKKIDHGLQYPNMMSATLDHIVPLCDGGEHTERNVQAAHFICNSLRGAGGVAQVRLF